MGAESSESGREQAPGRGARFLIGWWLLVAPTALFAANHLMGVWAFSNSDDERMMFIAHCALQVLGLIVLGSLLRHHSQDALHHDLLGRQPR